MVSSGHAESIVKGVVVLHNFLRREVGVHYMGPVPEICRELASQQHADTTGGCAATTNLQSLVRNGRRSATNACAVRDAFTKYFCSDVELFLGKMHKLHERSKYI